MTDKSLSKNVVLSTINELPVLRIHNHAGLATIAIQGAHLTEFAPVGGDNLIFVSREETYKRGKAIRGGVPICWPWFGPHPNDSSAPAHGLVRAVDWDYEVVSDEDERTDVRFTYVTTGDQTGFNFKAKAELLVSVGSTLVVSLTTTNLDDKPFQLSQALHTYFNCRNIKDVAIHGLNGFPYMNKLTSTPETISGDFKFDQEVDSVVQDQGQPISVSGLGHSNFSMSRQGSRSLVLWNPWIETAKGLSNFNDLEYKNMFCAEACNALEDSRLVKPNTSHVLLMEITPDA